MIKKTFKIKSALEEIGPLVKEILNYLKKNKVSPSILDDVKLAAEEALINAVRHGNKFKKNLPVMVNFECSGEEVRISVEDKGNGYEYSKIPDPTLDENIARGHGRGVFLIRRLMDGVNFNKTGNRIEMVKYIK